MLRDDLGRRSGQSSDRTLQQAVPKVPPPSGSLLPVHHFMSLGSRAVSSGSRLAHKSALATASGTTRMPGTMFS